jgi:hypothetical protein
MSDNNQNSDHISDSGHETKPHESLEEFSKRVGLKYIREKGGVEFCPYHGGNLLRKRGQAPAPQDEFDEQDEQDESKQDESEQDEFDALPEDFKEHMWKAFIHKAGHGPHPGKYQGPSMAGA